MIFFNLGCDCRHDHDSGPSYTPPPSRFSQWLSSIFIARSLTCRNCGDRRDTNWVEGSELSVFGSDPVGYCQKCDTDGEFKKHLLRTYTSQKTHTSPKQ